MNIKLSPEGLEKLGNDVKVQANVVEDALNGVKQSVARLDSWKSENKDIYNEKLNSAMPDMEEMVTVLRSYGNVAIRTANRLREVEERIKNSISEY